MRASGSGTNGGSSKTPIPGAVGRSPGPPRNGFAKNTQSSGSSTPASGRPSSSGWPSWRTPTGRARPASARRGALAYSPYLLSGVLRCGCCGARMVAQTTTRRKRTEVYRYGVYRCGFAKTKGPAVCSHGIGYRQERLEGALVAKFRDAMTAPMIDALAAMVNAQLEAAFQGHDARTGEIERLEAQASHLVRFLATGGDSPAVRTELRTIETTLEGHRAEWVAIEKAAALPPPRVHPAWVMSKLEQLDDLLRRDPQRAKVEILKHLDGDLVIAPRPSVAGERRAEISGRARSDSLLGPQEAVCLQVVAGARKGQT